MNSRANISLTRAYCAFAVVLLIVLLRLPDFFGRFHDWDEAAMMSQAWAMTQGLTLYKDIFQIHPVLNIAFFTPFFLLFSPENAAHAVKLSNALLILAGARAVHAAVKKRACADAAVAAAAAFALLLGSNWALSSHGEFYAVFPVLLAADRLLFRAPPSSRDHLVAGVFLGVAFHFKQTAIFDSAALCAASLWLFGGPRSEKFHRAALTWAGFAAVAAAALLFFFFQGALAQAAYSMWARPVLHYTGFAQRESAVSAAYDCARIFGKALFAWLKNFHLFAAAAVAAPILLRRNRPDGARPLAFALAFWLAADMAGLALIGRFYPHYLLQLVPPAAFLCASFLSALPEKTRGGGVRLLLILSLAAAFQRCAASLSSLSLSGWRSERTAQSDAAAAFLRARTAPDDSIFLYKVWNLDIHYLAKRLSPNGIYMFIDMVAEHSHDHATERRARKELLLRPPKAVLVDPAGWLFEDTEAFFRRFLTERYDFAADVSGIRVYLRKEPPRALR